MVDRDRRCRPRRSETSSPSGSRVRGASRPGGRPRSPAALARGQPPKGRLLLGVRRASSGGEVARPLVVREVRDGAIDLTSEGVGWRALGEALEVGRKHGAPIDAHLPGAPLICEEDDAFGILVEAPKKSKEQL